MRNRDKTPHPASYQVQIYSFNHNPFTFFPHPSRAIFWGTRAMVSPQEFLLPSHAFFSLPQCESIPQAAVLHSSSPPGTRLHRQTAVWAPHRTQVPSETSSVRSSLMWSGLLPGACSRVYSAASTERCSSAVLWALAWAAVGCLFYCGPPWATRGQPVSPQCSPCRISALALGARLPLPSPLTLVSAGLFLPQLISLM